jgi:hypothetical protein
MTRNAPSTTGVSMLASRTASARSVELPSRRVGGVLRLDLDAWRDQLVGRCRDLAAEDRVGRELDAKARGGVELLPEAPPELPARFDEVEHDQTRLDRRRASATLTGTARRSRKVARKSHTAAPMPMPSTCTCTFAGASPSDLQNHLAATRPLPSQGCAARPTTRGCVSVMKTKVADDFLHHAAVHLVVPMDFAHQVDVPHGYPGATSLCHGAPSAHHGPSPSVGPSAQEVPMSPCACIAFPMAVSLKPEHAADDDRLLPDHEVQEVEEPRVRPRPVGVPGLGPSCTPWRRPTPLPVTSGTRAASRGSRGAASPPPLCPSQRSITSASAASVSASAVKYRNTNRPSSR